MIKVLFITEYIDPPYDEGIKKTVYNLYLDLDKEYELRVICRYGFERNNINIIHTNPLFFSRKVKLIIENFNPDTIVYLPFQSSTFASYLRLKVLSLFAYKAKIILIALQPKTLNNWQQFLVKFMKPKFGLTPSPVLKDFWDKIKVKNTLIPLLTNRSIFKPLESGMSKSELRGKYNLPLDTIIISHMGHLNEGRNLRSLIPLQNSEFQIVIVFSSSTPLDARGKSSLKEELLSSGVIILDRYIERIEEIYQLSDIYIFPVMDKNGSIGMPLSILEARSCGVPVITSNYGSIRSFMKDDFGGITYADPDNFLQIVNDFKLTRVNHYFKTKVPELNHMFYDIIHKAVEL